MNEFENTEQELASLKTHGWVSLFVVAGLLGGLAVWAWLTPIAGAVIAEGKVAVESHAKSIQHRDGGTIKTILVRDEDRVDEGQLLAELDVTDASAELAILQSQLTQARIREARLEAEISGSLDMSPSVGESRSVDSEQIARLVAMEQQVFQSRRTARKGQMDQISEQIVQIEHQVRGIEREAKAVSKQQAIVEEELDALGSLFKDRLVAASRVTALEKQDAVLEGHLGRLTASIAEARATIAERRVQKVRLEDDFVVSAMNELQRTKKEIAETRQRERATLERIERASLRAPVAGIIHNSSLNTIGGVVSPGETVMKLVPENDELLVDARIRPMDIDKIFLDQTVTLRLPGLDRESEAELQGFVTRIASDLTRDSVTRETYYKARVALADRKGAAQAEEVKLLPGMPAQVMLKTRERSVLSYLVGPFADHLSLAMRED